MPRITWYAFFQILGIRSHFQHLVIIVGFKNQIVSFPDVFGGSRGYLSKVSQKREHLPVYFNAIAHIVRPVMRNLKRLYVKIFQFHRLFLFQIAHGRVQLLSHTITPVDSGMNTGRCINRNIHLFTQMPHGFDMIGMVMSHKYGTYRLHRYIDIP